MESGGACVKRCVDGLACRRLVATTRTRTGLSGRHSLLLTTRRRRRRQYTGGKTGCGVQLSHSFQWRPGRTTDRRRRIGTTFHARRVVSAPPPTDSDGCAADGRPASQPATGSRALAVVGGGTASTLSGRGAHPSTMPPRVPNLCRFYDPRSKIRFASTPISPSVVSVLYGRNESVQKTFRQKWSATMRSGSLNSALRPIITPKVGAFRIISLKHRKRII